VFAMRTQCFATAVLACCALSCGVPTWSGGQPPAPDAQILVGPDATAPTTVLGDGGEPIGIEVFTPGRSVAPSVGSFGVMPRRAISGTLELSTPSLFNFATVCTAALCATGGLRP
jgi:hypothetical protein